MQALTWVVGATNEGTRMPERFVPATVPGAANLDWARATGMADWREGLHADDYRWMEDQWWVYTAVLPEQLHHEGKRVFFVTQGIDYEYDIRLNGATLLHHEGMYTPVEVELSQIAKAGDKLEIWILPIPKDTLGEAGTRQEAAQCCKPAASYSWDWHPRLVPTGMWEEAGLIWRDEDWLTDVAMTYALSEDLKSAALQFQASTHQGDGQVLFTLLSPKGQPVLSDVPAGEYRLDAPQLWWCNGYGPQPLYTWTAKLAQNGQTLDTRTGRVGLRTVELVMNPGSWDEPEAFPKGRSPVPITMRLNGVDVFCKGSNWVTSEVFYGTITKADYEAQLSLAKEANFNMLRCWGGGIMNKEAFFELCDEKGIMIWQEFPLACNDYRGTPKYLAVLEQEARQLITRLSRHACLALWCGGNELFNNWSLMTDQSLALRLLNKLCYELCPQTPFIATSPLFGMGHGCYLFRYVDGREVFQVMPAAHYTAYTEFGVPSISNKETCLSFATEEDLFPLRETELTKAHHAFQAWGVAPDTWCEISTLQDYFGTPSSLDQLIEWSQWLQSEGYRCIFEEARRQKPYCSMALNWCFNEPWPTLANNSLINYPCTPKASFYTVAQSCRGALASARIPKFSWIEGETFQADLWLLNDGINPLPQGKVDVYLTWQGKRTFLLTWEYPEIPANENLIGPTVRLPLKTQAMARTVNNTQLNIGPAQREKGAWHPLTLTLQAGVLSSEYTLLGYEVK